MCCPDPTRRARVFPLEVADILATTPAAVNSALQPARTRLQDLSATEDLIEEPSDPTSSALIDRYITSFDRADVAGITRLLADEVVLQMPPVRLVCRSRALRSVHRSCSTTRS